MPEGLGYRRPGPKGPRRLDWEALRTHVAEHPEATQKERAQHFGVSRHGIWHVLRRMGLSYKKTLGDQERDPQQRQAYRRLRER